MCMDYMPWACKKKRHSEGAQRLWESPLYFIKLTAGDCHEPNGSRNDVVYKITRPKYNVYNPLFVFFKINSYICTKLCHCV